MILKCMVVLSAVTLLAHAQQCPTGWLPFNDNCWYFSDQALGHEIGMTWPEAESWCQTNHGHLASYATIEERDWAYDSYLSKWDDTRWWIGLNDFRVTGQFGWSDLTPYDPTVADWKFQEPSESGKEDCVELWIDKPVYTGQWNDNNCDHKNPFVCKRATGTFESCPVGWQTDGQSCYKVELAELQWAEANVQCKSQGANLVSISSSSEQNFVSQLAAAQYANMWIGYSDTATPGTLKWSNPGDSASTYTSWAPGQPTSPLPYMGSTCTSLSQGNNFLWTIGKCSQELKYICERGLSNRCPYGWILLHNKCYEFVINANRLATWTTANQICQAQGAQLLRIESDEQELYVSSVLQQYQNLGFQEIWLGGSDIGNDDTYKWANGDAITKYYWDVNMPHSVAGREDCLNIYTGKTSENWETSNCFHQRPYICELPEGATIPPGEVPTTEGKCNAGWRHFLGYCYYFGNQELPQSTAASRCSSMYSSMLTSINDENEESFIVGNIQADSWIGLTADQGTYSWADGSTVSFINWASSATQTNGCVYVKQSGSWHDESCQTSKYFVCKTVEIPTPTGTINTPTGNPVDTEKCGTGGWISHHSTNQCYFVDAVHARTWSDSRYACQVLGGELVSINSPDEQNLVEFFLANMATVANVYTGGNDFTTFDINIAGIVDNGWMWTDGTPFNYINWNAGEPNNADNEDCMEIFTGNGLWNDLNCGNYRHYMCEKTGNSDNIVGVDITDSECRSNEACCFKHLGAEDGGILPDSALTASSVKNQFYNASRGRLNTQADVIIINDNIYVGSGHGAWVSKGSDKEPWLQVDFSYYNEVKGIITQGRNGVIQYTEREWTTIYKIRYSQDPDNVGAAVMDWEWLSDGDGNPIIFDGNADQNTQVTNLFPRPIIVRHIRCYPLEYKEEPALRLEYIGCKASCLNKVGMNSGYITDDKILASSIEAGNKATNARAPVDTDECLPTAEDVGADYRGWLSKTEFGVTCQRWSSQEPQSHDRTPENYPDAGLVSNYCRNPDGEPRPWCYTTNPNIRWQFCDVPVCPSYTPTGWSPSVSNVGQYIQVQFNEILKVSGITLYGDRSNYVSSYVLMFSDDGSYFTTYANQIGSDHIFYGLDGAGTEYTDILREPISTLYLRIQPRTWVGGKIKMQFEVNGCYVDSRITCGDKASNFEDEVFTVTCPSGCVEDLDAGAVYGTTVYTEDSAICPAGIHAGRVTNNHGGTVNIVKTSGATSYQGSFANGIQSQDAGASHLSLTFDGSVFRCEDGWKPWKDHCYFISPQTVLKNWHDARAECISMGADLTSIQSLGENDFVEQLVVQGDRGGTVWIGMSDLQTQNYYQWSDGSEVTMTKWNWGEPNGNHERCVNIYRLQGYWNDKECDAELPYVCKMEKEKLPPLDDGDIPVDEGCEAGWSAFESSCYRASTDIFMFIYANRICEESGAKLASIHDYKEQAFVHALITNTIPPTLGFTSWIGLAAKNAESGELYYTWETGEEVTYTNWDTNEPEVRFSCAIPFVYQGITFYECTTYDPPFVAGIVDSPWCSIDPVFNGRWISCGTGDEYGCTYLDDQTGLWNIDICGQNRYYVCEKDRIGYTQPEVTTPSTSGSCSKGWVGDSNTASCYQINEYSDEDRQFRLTWSAASDYCRAQGAELISIHSTEETEGVVSYVTTQAVYSYTYFWIGLNNIGVDAGYSWTDGTPVSYTYWSEGEPNNHQGTENCVETQFYDTYSGWNDLNCDALRNFICKIGKDQTPLDPPTLPPPLGNEDPGACGTDETWIRFTTKISDSVTSDKCYVFVDDAQRGWKSAENKCIEKGGHLVAIHSTAENSFLLSRGAYTKTTALWIGLHDVGGRSFYWSDGSIMDFINWAPGEPNNWQDSEGCVIMSPDGGLWNDDNCGKAFGYICEKLLGSTGQTPPPSIPVTGNCPEGFTLYGNACYLAPSDVTFSWFDAREWCTNNSAQLVSIVNQYEQAFLVNYLWPKGINFWIGLTDYNTQSGNYVWLDQSEVVYTNWRPGEPNSNAEGCAEMKVDTATGGMWNDLDCYTTLHPVCYLPRSDTLPEPPATPSTIGCKDGYMASEVSQSCFKAFSTPKSWQEARQACQSEGANFDLASITDIYSNSLVKSWFWQDIKNEVWLGLRFTEIENSPEVTFSWADGWPVSYTNWDLNEPTTEVTYTGSGCVYMKTDGTWAALPDLDAVTTCMTPKNYVCKQTLGTIPTTVKPGDGTCDVGFFPYGQNCYRIEYGVVDEKSRSWYESTYACDERGATLASFHSIDEVTAIIGSINETSHNLYIGLSSNGFDGWKWVDNTPADFFNWGGSEPNGLDGEHCVEMYPWDGTWNDIDCFEKRGYVCMSPQSYTRCNVPNQFRQECGYPGIDEHYCVSVRGCCFDATYNSENVSGCFAPEDTTINPSGIPIPNPTDGQITPEGLSTGAIVGIIIGMLVVIVALLGGVYLYMAPAGKTFTAPTLPSFSKEKPPAKGGFDNPIAGEDFTA